MTDSRVCPLPAATRPSKAELQLCVGARGWVELAKKAVSWPTIELAAEDALEAICEGVRDLRPNRRIAILQPDHCGELGFESLVPGLVIDPQRLIGSPNRACHYPTPAESQSDWSNTRS